MNNVIQLNVFQNDNSHMAQKEAKLFVSILALLLLCDEIYCIVMGP
jgi:hypothetical protein